MQKYIFQAAALIAHLFLLACQTVPEQMQAGGGAGHWTAKAQILNKETAERNVVDLEIFARKPDRLRMEVSGTFGVSVASFLSLQQKVQLNVHTQKKYFSGNVSQTVLQPVLGVPFDPRLLFPILFDEKIKEKGWSCVQDPTSNPINCTSKSDGLQISWSDRNGALKKINIEANAYRIQINVKDFKTKVEDEKVFTMSTPDSYSKYKLN